MSLLHPPLHFSEGTSIIKEQDGIIAFLKPSGIRSHPNKPGIDRKSLLQLPYNPERECYSEDGQDYYLIHRLDAPTSGIILICCDAGLAKQLRDLFADRRVNKAYLAVIKGAHPGLKAIWNDRIQVIKQGSRARAQITAKGEPAKTEVKIIRTVRKGYSLSLAELKPKTGRTHQLRIQCAHRGMPIVGDGTYGDFRLNRNIARNCKVKNLMLHAHEIEFKYSIGKTTHSFHVKAIVPSDFALLFDGNK